LGIVEKIIGGNNLGVAEIVGGDYTWV